LRTTGLGVLSQPSTQSAACQQWQGPRKGTPLCATEIVVVAMEVVMVTMVMVVVRLTRPPHVVTGVIDARHCSALWECRREGREDNAK
jgi:hypothetical protein